MTSSKISSDAMLVADRAEALQIALRRDQDARRSRHGFHDDRGDGLGAMQGDKTLQFIGEFGAMTGLTLGKGVTFDVERMPKMVDAGKLREGTAIVDDAADRNAAEADAVITPLAPDETGARSLAYGPLISERHFQGRFDGLGSGAREEDAIEAGGRDGGKPLREIESDRMAHLERRREIERAQLAFDRLDDLSTPMPRIDAPKPSRAVKDGSAVGGGVVHALGRHQHAR